MEAVSDGLCQVISRISVVKAVVSIGGRIAMEFDRGSCILNPVYADPKYNEMVFSTVAWFIDSYLVGPVKKLFKVADDIVWLSDFVRRVGVVYDVFEGRPRMRTEGDFIWTTIAGKYGDFEVDGPNVFYMKSSKVCFIDITIGVGDRIAEFGFDFSDVDQFRRGAPKLISEFVEGVNKLISVVKESINNREKLSSIVLFGLFP